MTEAAPRYSIGQVVTVFRSRRRQGSEAAHEEMSEAMLVAARSVPGFVDFKTFTAEDGEMVSLVTFATPEAHRAWQSDPRHRQAQRLGRVEFYDEYVIQVGLSSHVTMWSRKGA